MNVYNTEQRTLCRMMVVYLESVLRIGGGMAGDDAAVAQSQDSQRESDRIPAIAMVTWI